MTFGERLVFLRKTYKRTQEQLAQVLGIAKSTYCGYEISNREPSLEKITKLATFFEVPADFLLGTGVFSNWEEIENNKSFILEMIAQAFPDIDASKYQNNPIAFIRLTGLLLEEVHITDDNCLEMIFSTELKQQVHTPSKANKDDAGKQKLMTNYDLLNDEGQQDLVDYSDMLAGNPRKLKEGDKAVPIDA